jgi:hypothetical protein
LRRKKIFFGPGSSIPLYYPQAVLVSRGGCMFVEKARHLAAAGAVAMLVWDIHGEVGQVIARGVDGVV